MFGLAFALNGVELLHLNNVSTGCILLGGLFIYDVFWVRILLQWQRKLGFIVVCAFQNKSTHIYFL